MFRLFLVKTVRQTATASKKNIPQRAAVRESSPAIKIHNAFHCILAIRGRRDMFDIALDLAENGTSRRLNAVSLYHFLQGRVLYPTRVVRSRTPSG